MDQYRGKMLYRYTSAIDFHIFFADLIDFISQEPRAIGLNSLFLIK